MLEEVVVGQDIAIKSVVAAIRCYKTGNQPIDSFMFMGSTGVGKIELAKALACRLFNTENALVRIDMNKYIKKHAVSRLVGAPSGYVGYEEEFDEYIVFQPLDSKQIVEIELKQVQDRFKQRKKIDLHYTKGVVELLGTLELDFNFGAKPVNSVIQRLIENQLIMGGLRGDFKEGDSIMVDVDGSPVAKYLPAKKKIRQEIG
ncbi:hypothetical protein Ddye_005856 [Dipteronia dyeriana]|uniref:Clp ATPase C-terminal domain-containing protein n=1 Tax=Dipteronia dyeriana TaxID=168575 RepID=A0AAE0CQM7_9ROSI|nr:hypothetical protein Ddye_005856 [Dipteronia dyeriana]